MTNSITKPHPATAKPPATRQRSKAATRALQRRELREGRADQQRPAGASRSALGPWGAATGSGRSTSTAVGGSRASAAGGRGSRPGARPRLLATPSLQNGQKVWWMIAVPSRELLRRVPFVIAVMGLLTVGLAVTLWLSTRSTEDAATLSAMRARNQDLEHEKERLLREVEAGDSVTELARRAGELGMVPVKDVVKLVPQPDGSVVVVGQPKPAEGEPELPLDSGVTRPSRLANEAQRPQLPDRSTGHDAPAPSTPPPARDADPAPPAPVDDSVERVRPAQVPPPLLGGGGTAVGEQISPVGQVGVATVPEEDPAPPAQAQPIPVQQPQQAEPEPHE